MVSRGAVRRRPGAGAGSRVVGEVPHAGALPDGPIGEAHPEELHPAVGASPRVVPVVAAVRAPPRHLPPPLTPPRLIRPSSRGFLGLKLYCEVRTLNFCRIRGSVTKGRKSGVP